MLQRKEGRGHKHIDSLRALGHSTINVDLATREKLKELAGDTPVSQYVKGIAFGYIKAPGGGGGAGSNSIPLPGIVPPNKEATLGQAVALFLGENFDAWLTTQGLSNKWLPDSPHILVKEFLRRLKDKEIQPSMNFEKGEMTV